MPESRPLLALGVTESVLAPAAFLHSRLRVPRFLDFRALTWQPEALELTPNGRVSGWACLTEWSPGHLPATVTVTARPLGEVVRTYTSL